MYLLKKQAIIFLFVLTGLFSYGQKAHVLHLTNFDNKKLHFGFSLGLNTQDFKINHWEPIGSNPEFVEKSWENPDGREIFMQDTVRTDIASLSAGLTVAVVTNLRLGEYFDLRFLPGLSFGERQLIYSVNGDHLPVYNIYGGSTDLEYISVKSTYLDFPLLVKYKSSRLNNQRPYIIAGFAYRINISKSGEEDLIQYKKGQYYFEAGVGLDSYVRFFKFSTELKFSFGLNNLISDPPTEQRQYYTDAIDRMTSNIFTLSFHFE